MARSCSSQEIGAREGSPCCCYWQDICNGNDDNDGDSDDDSL